MRNIAACFIVFTLGCAHHTSAQTPSIPLKEAIIGSWTLQSYVRVKEDQSEVPWCKGVKGIIQYAAQNTMSVNIGCDPDQPADSPSTVYNHVIRYSATYEVKDEKTVSHRVLESSYPGFVGKELVRDAELNSDILTLTGNSGNGKFRIVWKKQK